MPQHPDAARAVPPEGIGATSLGVALLRAAESRRDDRLFDDPYAQFFVAAAAADEIPAMSRPARGPDLFALMAEQVAVRTRFFDDALLDASAQDAQDAQVVLLACGMDTRAFRLPWRAGTRVFEVDFPDTLAFKDAVLAERDAVSRCTRIEVAADLRADWPAALVDAGLRTGQPTIWLAEGVLYAFSPDSVDVLLRQITEVTATGSMLAFDHLKDSGPLRAARAALAPELAEMWRGGPAEEPGTWLRRYGWRSSIHDLAEVATRYGRTVPPILQPGHESAAWLVTARLR